MVREKKLTTEMINLSIELYEKQKKSCKEIMEIINKKYNTKLKREIIRIRLRENDVKMRNSNGRAKGFKLSKEHKEKIGKSNKGKKHSKEQNEEQRKVMLEKSLKKENHWNWNGGISNINKSIRLCSKYKIWQKEVYERDDYLCQNCLKKSNKLNVHHIKKFSLIISENDIKNISEALECQELWDKNNGITLCIKCHRKQHKNNIDEPKTFKGLSGFA